MPAREVWIGGCGGTAIALAGLTTGLDTEERISMEVTTSGVGIEATALHKAFTTRQVLLGVDVTIAPGEFVAIVGQSGCGKSTLLRLMAGLDTPDRGVVALAGEPPRPGSSRVRMMFQDARLLPWRRVIDNVGLGLPVGRKADAGSALAEVGLAERGGDWPSILSGGQRQRVALARALASRPRALLLDEPLGALDALTRLEMQGLIERVWQEHGFTAALVTHDVEEAVALADRIIVLSAGQVALDLQVNLPRPRDHAARHFTELKATVLDEVLGTRHERVARMHALSPAQADRATERLVRTA
jgi:sulfonate transport system ATP-binding protein